MYRSQVVLICLAYGFGLLVGAAIGLPAPSAIAVSGATLGIVATGGISGAIAPRIWRNSPRWQWWLAAGIVAAIAAFYLQARVPQLARTEIGSFVPVGDRLLTRVDGVVSSVPRLTSSDRLRFILQAKRLNKARDVSGKLYVTLPLGQGTGIYPGQYLGITGNLYRPQKSPNPSGFDFRDYLARDGIFAGLTGDRVDWKEAEEVNPETPPWGWWKLRQRIVKSLVEGLGSPSGQLVSSMVLGRRAVDLPFDMRDRCVRVGLAHVLAASGFQVSLILGTVLALTQRLGAKSRLIIGLATLTIYVGLTGIQPSVVRAALMGSAALAATAGDRRLNTLGVLMLVATFLLAINPLWIVDLGFQLSFLATLGLLVTTSAILPWLEWLPAPIASTSAVPLAVFPWVMPLQLYVFGTFPPYSILVNVATVPLTVIVTLGGVFSAIAGAIYPLAGSAIAWTLFYPVQALQTVIAWFANLPGSTLAFGKISLVQLGILYAIIVLVWVNARWGRRWYLAVLLAIALAITPQAYQRLTLVQATVLATSDRVPTIVVRDRGRVALLGGGSASTSQFTILPFLQQQGINRIDLAIALDSSPDTLSGWRELLQNITVGTLYHPPELDLEVLGELPGATQWRSLTSEEEISLTRTNTISVTLDPLSLQMQLGEQMWSIFARRSGSKPNLSDTDILVWSGNRLPEFWLDRLAPEVAIVTGDRLDFDTRLALQKRDTQLYSRSRDGAIQWSQTSGWQTTRSLANAESSLF